MMDISAPPKNSNEISQLVSKLVKVSDNKEITSLEYKKELVGPTKLGRCDSYHKITVTIEYR